jgi:hypothetical protein
MKFRRRVRGRTKALLPNQNFIVRCPTTVSTTIKTGNLATTLMVSQTWIIPISKDILVIIRAWIASFQLDLAKDEEKQKWSVAALTMTSPKRKKNRTLARIDRITVAVGKEAMYPTLP